MTNRVVDFLKTASIVLTITVALLAICEFLATLTPLSQYHLYGTKDQNPGIISNELNIWLPLPNKTVTKEFPQGSGRFFNETTGPEGFRVNPAMNGAAVDNGRKTIRILTLGDSFTWGYNVDDSETYPNQLYIQMKTALPEYNFEVINGANIFMTINEQMAVYDYFTSKKKLDIVVLIHCPINDLVELSSLVERKKYLEQTLVSKGVKYILEQSALARLALRLTYRPAEFSEKAKADYRENKEKFMGRYRELFNSLKAKTTQHGQQFLTLITHKQPNPWTSREEIKFFYDLVKKTGTHFINLDLQDEDYLYPDDVHFSKKGNMRVAQAVREYIAQHHLLPDRP